VEDLTQLGFRLTQAQAEYEQAFGKLKSGRGHLIGQAQKLKALGVKPTKAKRKNIPTAEYQSVMQKEAPNHSPAGGVSFTPILFNKTTDPQLGGAYIMVHGMPLFAAFNTNLAQRLEAVEVPGLLKQFSEQGLRHVYRPAALVMSRKRGRPVVIAFSWNGILRFEDGTKAPCPAPGKLEEWARSKR